MRKKISRLLPNWRYRKLSKKAVVPYPYDLQKWQLKLREEKYMSQYGQDKWVIENLFPHKERGFFVDIGAHDGVTFSNTFFLEREMRWSGLAVEPLPNVFQELQNQRSCICVNACVGERNETSRFQVIDGYPQMLSGLVKGYSQEHIDRIGQELEDHGGDVYEIEAQCFDINTLFGDCGIKHVDYLSIDIEGGELAVLQTLDFDKFSISVIGVENNYEDWRIPTLLEKNGYIFHSIVGDEFYVKKGI